ncbi:MAG: Gfo/Idh/MocA family oxidoreductase [Chloroflexales bacterium]|nr:Gfo/Idh/MocA family oxidoreductase [Chloroflexales bacterium]
MRSMMAIQPVKTAIIGAGNISDIYLQNCTAWPILDVVACANRTVARAEQQAAKYNIPRACSVEEALADPQIELIVNLTVPAAHGSIALAAIRAGKSVYNEKPLAMSREEARLLLDEAHARGLLVGCAPDTFLGAGLQTCGGLLDAGTLGQPVGATAQMITRGPDYWHPNPAFLFERGAGPLFDMGPYYLTWLISLFGPISQVSGAVRTTYPERTIHSEPRRGEVIRPEEPTHVASLIEFHSGPIATLLISFDVWDMYAPSLSVYGSAGTLTLPDPNTFGGPVTLRSDMAEGGREIALTHSHAENSRGMGAADLAYALRTGRPHRASGALAFHVLDTMHAILEAARTGRRVELISTCERPAPLPAGMAEHQLDV